MSPAPMDRSDLRVVVPREHRWLSVLYAALRRVRIPVRDAVLGDGRLRLTVGREAGDTLRVLVEPRAQSARSWRSTGRFAISYEGRRDLRRGDRLALEACHRALVKLESRMPERLRGFAAIARDEAAPEETIRKLFPFVTVERSTGGAGDSCEVLVRTISACNQRCPFCSGPKHDLPPSEAVAACIDVVSEILPGATLSLTGGEPTLKKSFLEEVRAALDRDGIGAVQVQTNAVSFASLVDPTALPASPRLRFFVSLHAVDPDVYDRCTGTRGLLPQALRGIERLLGAGHDVTLNCVVSALNLDHLDRLAADLPAGTPEHRPLFHVSALICPEVNPGAADYLVRYADLVPAVERASGVARGRGLAVTSLLSSTHATVPPCVLPGGLSPDWRNELGREARGGARDWVKADGCGGCVEGSRCLGVPRAYADRFGLDELRPIRARP